jgi:heme-degrading monooxygenase HmoA
MIARTWRGHATPDNAPAYVRHFRDAVRPQLERLPGFSDAYVLRRQSDDDVEIVVMTLWESMDAIRAFAGERPEVAVVEPEARAVLSGYDRAVAHYEVV